MIPRNIEARALGLQMGDPYFQVKQLLQQHNVAVLSSTYPLYGDMSRRVMWLLAQSAPGLEIYSIDEAFLDLFGMERYVTQLEQFGHTLRTNVKKRTGIPVCVGIAPTKTLAKLANRLAKKRPELGGVLYLATEAQRHWALQQVAVEDVWGIGRQYTMKLQAAGITTAADLAACSDGFARQYLGGVVGVRQVHELRGEACQDLAPSEDGTLRRRSICYSRTFGQPICDLPDLVAAVGTFTARAAEKLRRQGDVVNILTVFLCKNRYGTAPPPYSSSAVLTLPVATADTTELLRVARLLVTRLWQANTPYTKAGVLLDGLEPQGSTHLSLFTAPPPSPARQYLMAELDAVNKRFGRDTVRIASTMHHPDQVRPPWQPKAQWCSPAYTTRLQDLLIVR